MKIKDKTTKVSGDVKIIELYNNEIISEKEIKNNGTQRLFAGILRFLRGDFISNPGVSVDFLPRYLGVGSSNSTDWDPSVNQLISEITPQFRWDVVPTQITHSDDFTSSLTLVSIIPANVFAPLTEIKEIGLFYKRDKNSPALLNRIFLTNDDIIKVENDTSIRIEWNIILSNI